MAKKINMDGLNKRVESTANAIKKANEYERTEIIPIDEIDLNQDNFFNMFDSDETIEELAHSIEQNGLIHNIYVTKKDDGRYLLISGERRLKAFKYLKKSAIRATVAPHMDEFDILKKTFYGNTEVRDYSLEQRLQIIELYKEKLDELSSTGQYDVSEFKRDIAEAFHINDRQVNKLVAISDNLNDELTDLLCQEYLDINLAANFSQLPDKCQSYIASFFSDDVLEDPQKLAIAKEISTDFTKKIKSVISKNKTLQSKIATNKTYNEKKKEQNETELLAVGKTLEKERENNPNLIPSLEQQKSSLEQKIEKNKSRIIELEKEKQILDNKQEAEINKVKTDFDFIISQKLSSDNLNKDAKQEQAVRIQKEIHSIEKAIKKLKNMSPSNELTEILNMLESYKTKNL